MINSQQMNCPRTINEPLPSHQVLPNPACIYCHRSIIPQSLQNGPFYTTSRHQCQFFNRSHRHTVKQWFTKPIPRYSPFPTPHTHTIWPRDSPHRLRRDPVYNISTYNGSRREALLIESARAALLWRSASVSFDTRRMRKLFPSRPIVIYIYTYGSAQLSTRGDLIMFHSGSGIEEEESV